MAITLKGTGTMGRLTVRERAEALGIPTASELARRSGLSFTSAIQIWKTGQVGRIDAARKLSKVLGCTIDELVGTGGE